MQPQRGGRAQFRRNIFGGTSCRRFTLVTWGYRGMYMYSLTSDVCCYVLLCVCVCSCPERVSLVFIGLTVANICLGARDPPWLRAHLWSLSVSVGVGSCVVSFRRATVSCLFFLCGAWRRHTLFRAPIPSLSLCQPQAWV